MLNLATQVAIQASHRAHAASTQAAIQINLAHQRATWAAALLADRHLGDLSAALVAALGTVTDARKVMISAGQQTSILNKHRIEAHGDPELASTRLAEGIQAPIALKLPARQDGTFNILCQARSAKWHVLIVLKLVPASRAKTAVDEWWVQTAFPVGPDRLKRWERLGQLQLLSLSAHTKPPR